MYQINASFKNNLRYKSDMPGQYLRKEEGYKRFIQAVEYYGDYVKDKDRILNDIVYCIHDYNYINGGCEKENGWKYNKHIVFINHERFEYKTGVGINCEDREFNGFAQEKLVIDCLVCVINDTKIVDDYIYDEDDFLTEFGYTSNIESVREGEKCFEQMKENRKKLLKIIGQKTIDEIYDIIEF